MNCHTGQFVCTTNEGLVPATDCPIGCINEATSQHYTFDLEGNCSCLIYAINCRAFYIPAVHQMCKASAMLSTHDGELNVSGANLGATRHRSPALVVGNFHRTTEGMGDIIAWRTHSALQGTVTADCDDICAGLPVKALGVSRVEEEVGLLVGCKLAEELHGNGELAVLLASMAAAAGPPPSFTVLQGNGSMFNTRSIPSNSKHHCQINNRLDPMVKIDGRRNHPVISANLHPPCLSRQKPRQLFISPKILNPLLRPQSAPCSRRSLIR